LHYPLGKIGESFLAEAALDINSVLTSQVKHLKNEHIIVMVTTASKEEAETIAQRLLEAKLIACANIIGPVHSRFLWSGKIDRAEEYLVLMKSRKDLFGVLLESVKALHSYEVPEIIALPVIDASKAYLKWLDSCLR
jgi:periplasmic divalent cation tolerance protein